MMEETTNIVQEAFRLYEEGAYDASLALCTGRGDIALEILSAENLLALGRLGDAEATFRDLIRSMPGSSKLHFGIAEVFRRQGDERAAAEYAESVRLDPGYAPALRCYAEFFIEKGDFRAAIPIQKALVRISRRSDDTLSLMRSLIAISEGEEAIALYRRTFPEGSENAGYIEALIACQRYDEATTAAEEAWKRRRELPYLHLWLTSLSRTDPSGAYLRYLKYIEEFEDTELLFSGALLAKQLGILHDAVGLITKLRENGDDPIYHLVYSDLLAATGELAAADTEYSTLISEELRTMENPESLKVILEKYISFLRLRGDLQGEVVKRVTSLLEPHPSWVCQLTLAELFEQYGEMTLARDAYYRGYRSDFLRGGIPYAAYLARQGECREAEMVMLYILSHVQRVRDLEMTAGAIVNGGERLYRNRKILGELQKRLLQMLPDLSADGREILSVASLYAASGALDDRDYQACKEHCLIGLDVMPCYPSSIRIEDFIPLLTYAKEHALSEDPVIPGVAAPVMEKVASLDELLSLNEKEAKVAAFLREHKETHEMELRSLLGTRRVAGVVNEIIRKAQEQGVSVIERRGVSENGEIYAWVYE
jgi:tetratricopeptide (TPR) repeat protein